MNEVHLTGLITTVWQYEGDTYLRIQLDRHRHSVGGRRQDRIAVRVPPHVGARTPLETGRHLSFHGYLEAEANGTVEEDLRRRLRRGGRRGPDAVERLIDDTPATIRRLPAREEQRLVAERIEALPSPRRGRNPNPNRSARNGRTQAAAARRPAVPDPAAAAAPAPPKTEGISASEIPIAAAAATHRTGEPDAQVGFGATENFGSGPTAEGDPNGGPVGTGSVGTPAPEDPGPDA